MCGVVGLCVVVWRRPLALRFGGRRATAGSRDRHVADTPPSWGEAVALWVVVVSSARCEPPLDVGHGHHETLDLVFPTNSHHDI